MCKSRYSGLKCDECDSGFGNVTLGCPACECHENGSVNNICDRITGECLCKEGAEGEKCDQCQELYFGLSEEFPDGCEGEYAS